MINCKSSCILSFVIVCFVMVFLSTTNVRAEGKIEKVVVSGSGLSEDKAIQSASKTAIQQVVGMYVVSDTVMQNRELIKDEVFSQSNAYIKTFKVY